VNAVDVKEKSREARGRGGVPGSSCGGMWCGYCG